MPAWRPYFPLAAALLALAACGDETAEPDLAVDEWIRGAFEVLAEHQAPAGELLRGPEHEPLRRALRETFDRYVKLPFGLPSRHPVVDQGTALVAETLMVLLDQGYEIERLDWRRDADPPTARVQVNFPSGNGRWEGAVLHLQRRGGKWVWTEPFERPRRVR
ncbi:MAG TPA: hypothetical protein VGC54_02190 [Planctomycetota bacterium]